VAILIDHRARFEVFEIRNADSTRPSSRNPAPRPGPDLLGAFEPACTTFERPLEAE
jgi:hypothetical protein